MVFLPALLLSPACLPAPAEEPWLPLVVDASRGLWLEYRVRPSATGVVLQLRNGGAETLRFGLRLSGEPMSQARERGRFRLDPGGRARVPLAAPPTGIEIFDLATGEGN